MLLIEVRSMDAAADGPVAIAVVGLRISERFPP